MLLRLRKDGVTIIIICTEERREGIPVKRARRRAGNNNLSTDTDKYTRSRRRWIEGMEEQTGWDRSSKKKNW